MRSEAFLTLSLQTAARGCQILAVLLGAYLLACGINAVLSAFGSWFKRRREARGSELRRRFTVEDLKR